jgi:hypothetical protein
VPHEREGYANQKWGYPLNIHPISKEERQMQDKESERGRDLLLLP